MPNLEGKVAIVTGAGRGIGREHALALARAGREGRRQRPRRRRCRRGRRRERRRSEVVDEIEALGGEAVAERRERRRLRGRASGWCDAAIDTFGRLDILVNNAGILRDRMLVNMEEDEWDAVIDVHLKGHFAPTRHAAAYWREHVEGGRRRCAARVINTSSPSGVFGNVGQTNYGAAKAGIAGVHDHRRAGARPLRRDRQLHRAERAHAHDRGGVRRARRRRTTASTRSTRRTTRRSSSRSAPTRRRTSPARSSSSTAARSTCCAAGTRASCSRATRAGTPTRSSHELRRALPGRRRAARDARVDAPGRRPSRCASDERRAQPRAARRGARYERRGDYPSLWFEGDVAHVRRPARARARVARGLVELGVEPGDRVVVMMENSPDVAVAYHAIWRAGAVVTPAIFLLTRRRAERIISRRRSRASCSRRRDVRRHGARRRRAASVRVVVDESRRARVGRAAADRRRAATPTSPRSSTRAARPAARRA